MSSPGASAAVLLMAYGAPNSLDEVETYLLDVRGGRPPSPELVAEIRHPYVLTGGRSPLLGVTKAQAQALEERLNAERGWRFRVYVGMRHWHPYIKEAVAQIQQDGHGQLVALCLAPHYSQTSVGAYFQRLYEALDALGSQVPVTAIDHWHDHPLLIAALAEKVNDALLRFSEDTRSETQVIFTAHSPPARIQHEGDPYPEQLLETARAVAQKLDLRHWQLAYQSAGQTAEPWLGSPIEEVIARLAEAGHHQVLVAPFGFVADNVEVLYDLDIAAHRIAEANSVHMERAELLNTSPLFIAALADLVQRHVEA